MKSFIKFVLVFSGILLLSAVLAPLLFQVLPFKFERIFNRLVMIFTLASLFVFVRLRREDFARWGLTGTAGKSGLFLRGFAAVWIILLGLVGFKALLGEAHFQLAAAGEWKYGLRLIKDLSAALLIGLIEEFFFRGVIYSHLKTRFHWPAAAAVGVTSIFYSLIHFISDRSPFIGPEPRFADSLKLIAAPFSSLANVPEYWAAAVGLFIFGVALNVALIRTGSLFPAMGIHAGAVFFIKSDSLFVDFLNRKPFLFGTEKQYDGVLGWLFLMLLSALLLWMFPSKKAETAKA